MPEPSRNVLRRIWSYRPPVILTVVLLVAAYAAGRAGGVLDKADVRMGVIEAPCDAACQAAISQRGAVARTDNSPFSPEQVKELEALVGPERVKELGGALMAGPKSGGPLNVRRLILKCYYWVPLKDLWERAPSRVYWVGPWFGDIGISGAKPEAGREWWRSAYDAETGEMFSLIAERNSLDCPTFAW